MQFDVLDQYNKLMDETLHFEIVINDKNDNSPEFKPSNVSNVNVLENIKEGENHVRKKSAQKKKKCRNEVYLS